MDSAHPTNAPAFRPGRPPRPSIAPRPSGAKDPALRDLAQTLSAGRWLVLGAVVASLVAAMAYLFVAPPRFRSSALLEIDDDANALARVEDLHGTAPVPETRDGEIERLRARRVIGPVVERLALDVVARPRRVPLLGAALARRHEGAAPASPLPWLSRFAWGGERISVSRLDVPPELVGVPLTLVALDGARYRVLDRAGLELATGEVGTLAQPKEVSLAILVSELVARPGTEFRLERLRREDVVDALLADLTVAEKGRKSGILEVTLEGREPAHVAAVVAAVAAEYVRQNAAQRVGEVSRTAGLVQAQLGALKTRLEAAEAALTGFKLKAGSVDLALETKAIVDRVTELQNQLADTEAQRSALRDRYTDRYPEMAALSSKASAIRGALQSLGARLRELPGTELRTSRLTRDVTVAAEQYVTTLNKIQALRVIQAGEVGTVRVMDPPVAARKPFAPKPGTALALALVLGLGLGVAAALVRSALTGTDDSQEIEDATGLPIFATVPHSDAEAKLDRDARGGVRAPLAAVAPDDLSTENLRTLRTVLAFLLKARGNIVAIGSPTPGAGKTFVTANLGHLLAAAGKRVLLADADLRRGTLHRSFALEASPGLAEVLAGTATVEQATRATGTPGLDLIPCGGPAAHPAELLASARLDEMLAALSKRYDVILLDTAPTLAVTDAVLVGRCASLNLLVLRSRQHPVSEIAAALERFGRSGVQVHGAIVNDARAGNRYARSYEHAADALA